jgi:predicted GIY-YIG superfamily endonuclease
MKQTSKVVVKLFHKLKQMHRQCVDSSQQCEVTRLCQTLSMELAKRVKSNDRQHNTSDSWSLDKVTRFLSGHFYAVKIAENAVCCVNRFHQSNQALIRDVYAALTNRGTNYWRLQDQWLRSLYLHQVLFRAYSMKDFSEKIADCTSDMTSMLMRCGCTVNSCIPSCPEQLLIVVKDKVVRNGKETEMSTLIEMLCGLMNMKPRKPLDDVKVQFPDLLKPSPRPKVEKGGYVYFLVCTSSNKIKIGCTTSLPRRFKQFKTGNPHIQFYKALKVKLGTQTQLEARAHAHFKEQFFKGEWFNITKHDVDLFIDTSDEPFDVIDIQKQRPPLQERLRQYDQCMVTLNAELQLLLPGDSSKEAQVMVCKTVPLTAEELKVLAKADKQRCMQCQIATYKKLIRHRYLFFKAHQYLL